MRQIVIEKQLDELSKEFYSFYISDFKAYLDEYLLLERKSKRHKYKPIRKYSRLFTKSSTIKESDVIIPDDMKEEIIKVLMSEIEVLKWSQR